MILDEAPTGSRIFVDAHIFIYRFSRVSSVVVIAMMQKRGLRTIATHDSDLRSIPDLMVYSPPDIS